MAVLKLLGEELCSGLQRRFDTVRCPLGGRKLYRFVQLRLYLKASFGEEIVVSSCRSGSAVDPQIMLLSVRRQSNSRWFRCIGTE